MSSTSQNTTMFMIDGGWCWFQDPRAIIAGHQLIIGGISGKTGDVRVAVYDLQQNRPLGEVVLHDNFERDDHDTIAFYLRPDGRLLAVYAKHALEPRHHFRLSEPQDFLNWGPETTFEHPIGDAHAGVTYMNLYTSAQENRLYNFFRDGPDFNPWFITSDDHGETWNHRTHLIADGLPVRSRPYVRYLQRDPDTIGFTFTEAHPRNFGTSLYYAQLRGGVFQRANGGVIKSLAEGPLLPAEAKCIYEGSGGHGNERHDHSIPNAAWPSAIEVDASGQPHIAYSLYVNHGELRYRLASWDGQRWNDREIAYAGGFLYPNEDSYTGLVALDPDDPTRAVISTDADPSTGKPSGGPLELFTACVGPNDHRETIQWEPLTTGSAQRNLRPLFVTGSGYKVLLWMHGRYSTFSDYDIDIVGQVWQRPTHSP